MENGLLIRTFDKVRAVKYGQMVPCTRAGGKTIKQTAKEDSSMPMVTSTTGSGKMTRHTVTVSTVI